MARRDHVDLGSSSPKRIDSDGLTPFKKNFYVESREVASMTEVEMEEYRVKREITIGVKDVPRPVQSFEDIGFPGTTTSYLQGNQITLVVERIYGLILRVVERIEEPWNEARAGGSSPTSAVGLKNHGTKLVLSDPLLPRLLCRPQKEGVESE